VADVAFRFEATLEAGGEGGESEVEGEGLSAETANAALALTTTASRIHVNLWIRSAENAIDIDDLNMASYSVVSLAPVAAEE
jgi:hypothetical protein